jgi:hypothetical protein
MTNLLATGALWLAGQLATHCSESVVYRRGALTVTLAATESMPPPAMRDENGVLEVVSDRDFTFKAAVLILATKATLPQRGDRITKTNGEVYEVMHLEGANCYRNMDASGYLLRVHTKRVS